MRIVVVDDEQSFADTLAAILRRYGFDATAVYSGRAALACCDVFPPDLIITDVMMSDLNGVQTALLVRKKVPACRVLLVSGEPAANELAERVWEVGYDFELVAKPFTAKALIEKIARSREISPPAPQVSAPVAGR